MAAPKNPSTLGAKSDKIWRDAVMRAVKRRAEGKDKPQQLEKLADKLVDCALAGEVSALKEIGDRLDGRPSQQLEHTGQDGAPLTIKLVTFKDAE